MQILITHPPLPRKTTCLFVPTGTAAHSTPKPPIFHDFFYSCITVVFNYFQILSLKFLQLFFLWVSSTVFYIHVHHMFYQERREREREIQKFRVLKVIWDTEQASRTLYGKQYQKSICKCRCVCFLEVKYNISFYFLFQQDKHKLIENKTTIRGGLEPAKTPMLL